MKDIFVNYRQAFETGLGNYLEKETYSKQGMSSLFEPVKYIMSNGGKRIRPVLLLISCELFGRTLNDAINAAIAVEILHNFTLVHDDIMDNASTRRGRETVHKKWDVNAAILVGDELIGLSYRSLLNSKTERIGEIVKIFTDGIIEVCEGQALDKEFEQSDKVTISDYYVMIRKKTAELLKVSASIGAIIGGANQSDIESIREYSENIGLAFQIQDDLLDVIGNESKFGKKIGGDIIERKKTFLYLKAIEILDKNEKENFIKLFESDSEDKISQVIKTYSENCIIESAKKEIERFTGQANNAIKKMSISQSSMILSEFSDMLLKRNY